MILNSNPSPAKVNFIRKGPKSAIPMVFLHAVGLDHSIWQPQVEYLSRSYDIIAIDLPGHGYSEKLMGTVSFEAIANHLIQFLADNEIESIHLVGISFGSMVAQHMAIIQPDLIKSLTLIGSACTFSDHVRGLLKQRANYVRREGMDALAPLSIERWFTAEYISKHPDKIEYIKSLLHLQDAAYHATLWDLIAQLNTQEQLKGLEIPSLVIVGEKDTSTPLAVAEILAAALRTDNLKIVAAASHITNIEAAEMVNQVIADFMLQF